MVALTTLRRGVGYSGFVFGDRKDMRFLSCGFLLFALALAGWSAASYRQGDGVNLGLGFSLFASLLCGLAVLMSRPRCQVPPNSEGRATQIILSIVCLILALPLLVMVAWGVLETL
jgi:hypothetical protein